MRNESLDKCVRILLNALQLKAEYREGSPKGSKALLVEGETDKAFIGRMKQESVLCCTAAEVLAGREAFIPGASRISRKSLILTLLTYLSGSPEFFGFPRGSQHWPVYGLIDRDYEDEIPYMRISRLLITDTHDIETLMLSTDRGLLDRLETLTVLEETRLKALYLAGQLARFRQAVYREGTIGTRVLKGTDGFVDYAAFTENDRIVLSRLTEYMNSHREEPLSAEKLRQVNRKIAAAMKKQLDAEGAWKKGFESFPAEQDEEYWALTNGHDILSAICYYQPEARSVFKRQEGHVLNREFEFALISLYDLRAFRGTELCGKMSEAELVIPGLH